jgi:hypothetical protein
VGRSATSASRARQFILPVFRLPPRLADGIVSDLPGFGGNASEHFPFIGLEGDNVMIQVNRSDGVCRACGGTLQVTDADDATMFVECDDWS